MSPAAYGRSGSSKGNGTSAMRCVEVDGGSGDLSVPAVVRSVTRGDPGAAGAAETALP